MAMGWLTLFGNDTTSASLANAMRSLAYRYWSKENEIYKVQTQEGYREMMNLGRYRMKEENLTIFAPSRPAENELWNAVKDSTRMEDFQIYLDEYPLGSMASVAKMKVLLLRFFGAQIPPGSLTDIQYLNSRAKLLNDGPKDFESQLNEAKSLCPAGCDVDDNETYLKVEFDARSIFEQTYPIPELEKALKSKLLEEYCRTESIQRNLEWGNLFSL
jgi:hypothetical protein